MPSNFGLAFSVFIGHADPWCISDTVIMVDNETRSGMLGSTTSFIAVLISKPGPFAATAVFYKARPVPSLLQPLINACISGDLEDVKSAWRTVSRSALARLGRDDTAHPLLHAVHRLHEPVVAFLLRQGLNPRQRGTVHPFTGDGLTVAELTGG
jgi:hypothetical protein